MGTLFSYFEGNLEEYLSYIQKIEDNRLVKTRLAPATALEDIGQEGTHETGNKYVVYKKKEAHRR